MIKVIYLLVTTAGYTIAIFYNDEEVWKRKEHSHKMM